MAIIGKRAFVKTGMVQSFYKKLKYLRFVILYN